MVRPNVAGHRDLACCVNGIALIAGGPCPACASRGVVELVSWQEFQPSAFNVIGEALPPVGQLMPPRGIRCCHLPFGHCATVCGPLAKALGCPEGAVLDDHARTKVAQDLAFQSPYTARPQD
jgi:hypothetical protein